MEKIPVIIDTDPGHDDAIALMLALASDASMLLAMKHEARCYAESRSSQKAFAAQWKLIETLTPQACW